MKLYMSVAFPCIPLQLSCRILSLCVGWLRGCLGLLMWRVFVLGGLHAVHSQVLCCLICCLYCASVRPEHFLWIQLLQVVHWNETCRQVTVALQTAQLKGPGFVSMLTSDALMTAFGDQLRAYAGPPGENPSSMMCRCCLAR